ncbi:MAG: metallophosphoesterase [Candidatus Pacearchaeota archaeon]
MKILVIGDFHGKFQKKFGTLVKKEKIDLVVSLGDYSPFHYRKLWFKHCYGKDVELWEVIGKKKWKELILKDLKMAENSLNGLNKLPVPVYTVLGNIDWPAVDDISDFESSDNKSKKNNHPNYERTNALAKRIEKYKNIKRFDYKALKFGDYVFIGMRGHSVPGYVKSKAYRKHRKILDNLFKKFRKENKEGKVIFVSHNIAYDTKLDKISMKAINFIRKNIKRKSKKKPNRHYGSKMARRVINRWQPFLHLGGHIHESVGKDNLGRTVLVNPGAAHEGRAVVIELSDEKKGKIKNLRFVK